MGFSLSLFVCQSGVVTVTDVPEMKGVRMITDRGGPAIFEISALGSENLWRYVYVDNLAVLGCNRDAVWDALTMVCDALESKRLCVHEREIACEEWQGLGVHLDGRRLRSTLTAKRFRKVALGIRSILQRGRCAGWA